MSGGYIEVYLPEHPTAYSNGYVREHVLVAERALGKPLPDGAVVHHVNEGRTDNRPGNLVICQDQGYHRILHRRMAALEACGHANWLRCEHCKEYDDPARMWSCKTKPARAHHRACNAAAQKRRRERKS